MPDFSIDKKLNENNIQAPFQYKPSEDGFILNDVKDEIALNKNNSQVAVIDGEKIFAVDLGYSVDGDVYEMTFNIDKIKIYPVPLNALKELRAQEIKDNSIYFVKDVNFKSIAFLSIANLNKTLSFEITSYASVFSSYMFNEVAKKINSLDTNYPVKNFYPNTDYKTGDIIKKDGYLYQVIKDFTSNDKISNSIIITPFIRKENSSLDMYSLLQDNNKFFVVNSKNGDIKPLTSIITWTDTLTEIYKDMIIVKKNEDGNIEKKYIVLEDVLSPIWDDLIETKKIVELYTAKDILYNNAEAENMQDGLDLAFTKIATETEERLKKDAELENELNTKQKTLEAGDNIEIKDNANNQANIKVAIHNKYDLTYKKPVFPKLSYEIPDAITFSLNVVDNVNIIEATIKKTDDIYTFNTKITLTEAKESITLEIKNINAVDLSQFFTPNTQYELENCYLTFDNNAMTLLLMPKPAENGEVGTFEAGDLTLSYIFTEIYNKNIYFITKNNGYIELKQDETKGTPRGTFVKFEKIFEVAIVETETEEEAETEAEGVDFIELGILNEVIAQYFNTIDDFNIDNFIATDGIHFIRTTQEGDAELIIATEKANFGMMLENGIYRFGICRRDKGKILNKDEVVISLTPDTNAELETKIAIADNLDNTIQALTEKDAELETKITTEITNREEADTTLQNNIDTEENERIAKDTELEELITSETTERTTENTNIKNSIGDLNTLKTTKKDNIVNAINEVNDKAEAGGGGSVDIVDSINKNDTRKNVVPNPFAVNSFVMSLIPVDIVSDKEFDTGKTLDGKKIYGYYAKTYPFLDSNISVYKWIATIPFGVSMTTSNDEPSTIRLPMQCISNDINDGVYYIEFSGFTADAEQNNYKSAYCEMRYLPVNCGMPSSWFNGFIFYTKD